MLESTPCTAFVSTSLAWEDKQFVLFGWEHQWLNTEPFVAGLNKGQLYQPHDIHLHAKIPLGTRMLERVVQLGASVEPFASSTLRTVTSTCECLQRCRPCL
jgi:hypothetical protein